MCAIDLFDYSLPVFSPRFFSFEVKLS
jgi:hypothetical protein